MTFLIIALYEYSYLLTEPKDKNLYFLYTLLILYLMRSLANRWSPLTHASHCMTTSRPAAATQTRARVSPAMQPEVYLCRMPLPSCPSLFMFLGTGSEFAGLHSLRLG